MEEDTLKIVAKKQVYSQSDLVKITFYITYVLLITTGTITIVEALATSIPSVRHVLNLETCISIIAGYFYSQFIKKIDDPNFDYKDINVTRYTDWFITTPLMLLALMLVLSYNIKQKVPALIFLLVVVMNFIMLYLGYLGEKEKLDKKVALLTSFLFFFGVFGLIWFKFIKNYNNKTNYIIFGLYVFIWSIYGLVYMADEETKNITFNVLDLTAKCMIGLMLWAYFTKVIVF